MKPEGFINCALFFDKCKIFLDEWNLCTPYIYIFVFLKIH